MPANTILIIGGAGYIGSHICKALHGLGLVPATFDNLSSGHKWAVKWGPLVEGQLHSAEDLDRAFEKYTPSAVIHLASSINVRESLENPGHYYENNLSGTLSLASAMVRHSVSTLIFSSSASVYGDPRYTPIDEKHPKAPLNPYGRTKWMAEELFEDFHRAHGLNVLSLRYFNAAGADPESEVGEAHSPETHLIPTLIATAQGHRPSCTIYGQEFPTKDGTAIRDYIHVSDLASAHCLAIDWLEKNSGCHALNLGTGKGHSIREVIAAVEKKAGAEIPLEYTSANVFESSVLIAEATKASQLLGWKPIYSEIDTIVETAWNWHATAVRI